MSPRHELTADPFDLASGVKSKTGATLAIQIQPYIGRIAAYLLDETGTCSLPGVAYELLINDKPVASGQTDEDGYLCHDNLQDDYYTLRAGDEEFCLDTIGEDDEPHQICVPGQDCDRLYDDIDPQFDGEIERNMS